jgi:N-acyl-D-amino-acid deacylase
MLSAFNRFIAFVLLAGCCGLTAIAQTVPDVDLAMTETLAKWSIPGGSLAIAKDGRLVYAKGFGVADIETGDAVSPGSLFRIASLSKTITSAAILALIQEGRLSLDTKAFDVLQNLQPSPAVVDERIRSITVRQLLQHTAGWDRAVSGEVVLPPYPQQAARAFGVPEPAEPEVLVRYALGRSLDFDPGSRMAYSNLGYMILGRIIENVSGMRYETFVRTRILGPAGIYRAFPGRILREQRAPDEVRYHTWPGEQIVLPNAYPELAGPVEPQYGAAYHEIIDAAGGWVASAIDIVRFAVALDDPVNPLVDIATLSLLNERPSPHLIANGIWYGLGWLMQPSGSDMLMIHAGGLPGTRAFIVKRQSGLVWVALFNSGRLDESDDPFLADMSNRIDAAVRNIRAWPGEDQFPQYFPDAPRFVVTGVQNRGSYDFGVVSPGEAVSIFHAGCRQVTESELRVFVDDRPAIVTGAFLHRVDAVLPEELGTEASVRIDCFGQPSEPVRMQVVPATPALLTMYNTGRGQALAVNHTGRSNAPDEPASRNTMLTVSATGIRESDSCSVQLGAAIIDAVAVQQVSPGIVNISFQIPEDASTGTEVPIAVVTSGMRSRIGVSVSIR